VRLSFELTARPSRDAPGGFVPGLENMNGMQWCADNILKMNIFIVDMEGFLATVRRK
jgi:hypothetical protein